MIINCKIRTIVYKNSTNGFETGVDNSIVRSRRYNLANQFQISHDIETVFVIIDKYDIFQYFWSSSSISIIWQE